MVLIDINKFRNAEVLNENIRDYEGANELARKLIQTYASDNARNEEAVPDEQTQSQLDNYLTGFLNAVVFQYGLLQKGQAFSIDELITRWNALTSFFINNINPLYAYYVVDKFTGDIVERVEQLSDYNANTDEGEYGFNISAMDTLARFVRNGVLRPIPYRAIFNPDNNNEMLEIMTARKTRPTLIQAAVGPAPVVTGDPPTELGQSATTLTRDQPVALGDRVISDIARSIAPTPPTTQVDKSVAAMTRLKPRTQEKQTIDEKVRGEVNKLFEGMLPEGLNDGGYKAAKNGYIRIYGDDMKQYFKDKETAFKAASKETSPTKGSKASKASEIAPVTATLPVTTSSTSMGDVYGDASDEIDPDTAKNNQISSDFTAGVESKNLLDYADKRARDIAQSNDGDALERRYAYLEKGIIEDFAKNMKFSKKETNEMKENISRILKEKLDEEMRKRPFLGMTADGMPKHKGKGIGRHLDASDKIRTRVTKALPVFLPMLDAMEGKGRAIGKGKKVKIALKDASLGETPSGYATSQSYGQKDSKKTVVASYAPKRQLKKRKVMGRGLEEDLAKMTVKELGEFAKDAGYDKYRSYKTKAALIKYISDAQDEREAELDRMPPPSLPPIVNKPPFISTSFKRPPTVDELSGLMKQLKIRKPKEKAVKLRKEGKLAKAKAKEVEEDEEIEEMEEMPKAVEPDRRTKQEIQEAIDKKPRTINLEIDLILDELKDKRTYNEWKSKHLENRPQSRQLIDFVENSIGNMPENEIDANSFRNSLKIGNGRPFTNAEWEEKLCSGENSLLAQKIGKNAERVEKKKQAEAKKDYTLYRIQFPGTKGQLMETPYLVENVKKGLKFNDRKVYDGRTEEKSSDPHIYSFSTHTQIELGGYYGTLGENKYLSKLVRSGKTLLTL